MEVVDQGPLINLVLMVITLAVGSDYNNGNNFTFVAGGIGTVYTQTYLYS